jgi:phosphoribosylformimino-5-aminoimidazole carboxamide ribonucleotide (ProFAR) isomerase
MTTIPLGAGSFSRAGAEMIHVVDLDGAFSGIGSANARF